jgi:hypothetical protein
MASLTFSIAFLCFSLTLSDSFTHCGENRLLAKQLKNRAAKSKALAVETVCQRLLSEVLSWFNVPRKVPSKDTTPNHHIDRF